jgi:hypothetical protein
VYLKNVLAVGDGSFTKSHHANLLDQHRATSCFFRKYL